MENTSNVVNENTSNGVNKNPSSVTISRDDLQIIVNIILVVSKRGGFLLDEYKVIGELYDRLKLI